MNRLQAFLLILPLGAAACTRSCRDRHPYVPYVIGDASEPTVDGGVDASVAKLTADASAPFSEVAATPAPPNTTLWAFEGETFEAPEGANFVAGIARDLDGDGVLDYLLLVHRPSEAEQLSELGELIFCKGLASGGVDVPTIVATPGGLTIPPGCTPTWRLGQVGQTSVVADFGYKCDETTAPAARWFGVMSFRNSPRVQFSAIVVDPPHFAPLIIEADGADRDSDGIGDLSLRFSLALGRAVHSPSVTMRWFDRPAGMSRDADEPEVSFRVLATEAHSRAAKAGSSNDVSALAASARQLFQAVCGEGASARLTQVTGVNGLTCSSSRALEELGYAEAHAFARDSDLVGAALAADRASQAPAARTPGREKEATAMIAKLAPIAQPTLRFINAVPRLSRPGVPSWGALAFDDAGRLLVETASGVVRVDTVSAAESNAEDITPWRTDVVSPDGTLKWVETTLDCSGRVQAVFEIAGGPATRDIDLPVFVPKTKCASSTVVKAIPMAWSDRGLEAIVAGELVSMPFDASVGTAMSSMSLHSAPLGSPRSRNGRFTALPTVAGVLVVSAKPVLIVARELENTTGAVRDCAVSDDGHLVACVRQGRVILADLRK